MSSRTPEMDKSQVPLELNDLVKEEIRSKLKDQNLEHRTKLVEEAMAPLINKVVSISEHNGDQQKKKEKPQKLSKLIHLVDMATRNFLIVGEEIAHENPDFREELLYACDDVRSNGELLQAAALQFSQSPCEPDNRSRMTKSSKDLLLAVTRLLVVADMADVNKLLEASSRVEARLNSLHTASTDRELAEMIDKCVSDMSFIIQRISIQPNDEKSEAKLQVLATAQVELNRAKRMLTCTSKAFIQFSGAREAKENQDYVVLCLLDSLKTVSLLASGDDSVLSDTIQAESGELAVSFQKLKKGLDEMVPLLSSPTSSSESIEVHITDLQKYLGKILLTSAELASSRSTRDYRQHALITLCGHLKTGMSQLAAHVRKEVGDDVQQQERSRVASEQAIDVEKKAEELQKELYRVAVDQVSDVFMSTLGPLVSMCETAQEGREQVLEQRAVIFENHANNMRNTALLLCSLSDSPANNKQIKLAVRNIRTLIPRVINAAYILVRKPSNIVGLKSMSVFKETWSDNISALTEAVDFVMPLLEFMAATEDHVCEDGRHFLMAAKTCNVQLLDDMTEVIRNRCKRLCRVIKTELKKNRSFYTTEQTRQSHGAMEKLKTKFLSQFCDQAIKAYEILRVTGDIYRVNFKGLEESLRKVVDNVRNVRRSILVTRVPEELEENESDLEDLLRPPRPLTPTPSVLSQLSTGSAASTIMGSQITPQPKFQRTPQHSMVFEVEDTRKTMMAQLTPEHQAHLAKVTEALTAQQAVFEAEVNKWDDTGNDIVMLAKEMCGMMVDMSDFTRGVGPLHSTTDIIVSAKDIARAAGSLDGIARKIADHCPDVQCQRDIRAYLERMRLYCHQLNITANVKADLRSQSVRDTVENASTLIATSKNLMTTVVETVKTCYIASIAITRIHGGSISDQFVQWRLTLPRKKKLYHSDTEKSDAGMEHSAPLYELSKFKGRLDDPQMSRSTVAETPYH